MKKTNLRWIHLAIVCLAAVLIVTFGILPARAGDGSPDDMLQRAWRNAQEAGSYRFITNIDQTLIPRPVTEMIGQQETAVNLALDGAVVLPGQSYSELRVLSGERTKSVVLLRDGDQSFMLQDGELKPVDNVLSLASQSNDLLGYLSAADQVVVLESPPGHPELVRYSFVINGPRYAEYVRKQTETALRAEPGAPQGLTIKPLPALKMLSGQGELWVNQAGYPVRQVLDLEMPEVTDMYGARIRMSVDLSAYGKVDGLPHAVRGADGVWRLEGPPPAGATSSLDAFSGFGDRTALSASSEQAGTAAAGGWWSRLVSSLPLRISPTSVLLFVVLFLVVLFIYYYRRNLRRCYAVVVIILVPIFVFSPLLESAGVVRFMERQVQAAEASASALPELLGALGFDTEAIEAASAAQTSAAPEDAQAEKAQSALDAFESSLTPRSLANAAYSRTSLQAIDENGQPPRCGDGEPGVDTDGDGLTDAVELCVGTNPNSSDTDGDGITDQAELEGFILGEQRWFSDPLKSDSNEDGIADNREWSSSDSPYGQAASADLDGDGIPNLWDDDDDGDGVPDALDLSPFTVTDPTESFSLSTQGSGFNGYEFIEFQVRPVNADHLRYTTTVLDWPYDEHGNIQDLDNTTADIRLMPFLKVNTNLQPDPALAQEYGFISYPSGSEYTLLVPLMPIEDGGAIHAFYGKVAYAPGQTDDIQWQASLIWMTQAQHDTWVYRYHWWDPYRLYPQFVGMNTEAKVVHQYQDEFRLTGLHVTKDAGFEAAVLGTPEFEEDLYLFEVLLGLRHVFQGAMLLEGQQAGETALQELAQRFANNTEASYSTFNVFPSSVAMTAPVRYGSQDAGMVGVGAKVPEFLSTYAAYYGQARCQEANGNWVACASLLTAYESKLGVRNLADLPLTDGLITADLSQLHVNLADVPVLTNRGARLQMYEQGSSGAWHAVTAARMLELTEQRYKDTYDTALRDLYPELESDDMRLIAFTAYLWAIAPFFKTIALDGEALVPELADEAQLALDRDVTSQVPEGVKTVLEFVAVGSGLVGILSTSLSIFWAMESLTGVLKKINPTTTFGSVAWEGIGSALFLVSTVFSTIMSMVNVMCSGNSNCLTSKVLKGFNIAAQSLALIAQIQCVLDLAIKFVTKWAIVGFQAAKAAMEAVSAVGKVGLATQAIGMVIGITMSVLMFALTVGFSGGDPIIWRVALAAMIVTIVWTIVLFVLNFIPFGALISGILALIDMLLSFIFNLLGLSQFAGVAALIVGMFYSVDVVTSLLSVEFGEFSSGMKDPDMGMVGGNTFQMNLPANGVIQKMEKGKDYDLQRSWVKGVLEDQPGTSTFAGADMSQQVECVKVEGTTEYITDTLHCANTAVMGYALTPSVNGTISFVAKALYATVWAEYMLWGTARVNSHVRVDELPEDPEPTTIYLDVLPASLSDLWSWFELGNPDRDGDELTNDEENAAGLGTSPDSWDSDGDGLSDRYEWANASLYGTNPLLYDTDEDGLPDGLERRYGTQINVADSDGDGLSDGEEVRRFADGVMIGGWQVSLPDGPTFWVSSDPLNPDSDGDGLTDAEERANGLNPKAVNPAVPALRLSGAPVRGLVGGRAGAYWLPGEAVAFTLTLGNYTSTPVTQPLSLTLPDWLDSIEGGALQGNQTLPMDPPSGNTTLTWTFSPEQPLRSFESVSVTVQGRVSPAAVSARGVITLELRFGDIQLCKTISAVVDGDDPNLMILAPVGGAYLRGRHYVVGGSAIDPTTWITEASLSIVPLGAAPSYQALPVTQGPWAYTWELPDTDGVYSLQAQATDAMGHTRTVGPVNVTVDNTPPVVNISHEMAAGVVRLWGTASDNMAGVRWVQLSLDGQPWRSIPFDGTTWSYDWAVGANAQGKHEAQVRAFDWAGNLSNTLKNEMTVDSVAPSSIVNAGADRLLPPAVQPGAAFNITGVADEGGHLPLPVTPADLRSGMDVFDDSAVWLGVSTIHDNDGGVLAAWIGDFNADRLSDLAVGLPGPEGAGGYVSVIYGRSGGWTVAPDLEMLATSPMRFIGVPGARLGSLLAAAGDANGDNLDDLLVGERGSRRAFLIFGNPRPLGGVTLDSGQSAYRVLLQAPDTITSLDRAGDVNGDGYGDLLVTAGGTVYLVLGHAGPWTETLEITSQHAVVSGDVSGAFSVGDVDNNQFSEWVTLSNGSVSLYGWNTNNSRADLLHTFTTADSNPHAVAVGDVNADGYADWIYTDGANRILVYGSGAAQHIFSSYDGFFAAPGDVDGDRRADILLSSAAGMATLVHQPQGGSPTTLATINGVGGAANAPYITGADLNSDGSAELLLIPSQAAAEARGFDAPDFSSGFISPQSLPLGAASAPLTGESLLDVKEKIQLRTLDAIMLAGASDTRYVDDDPGGCDGNIPCYSTIQMAVNASDGGGDIIIVYPGAYSPFSVPSGANYDYLTVRGVNVDAVFVDGAGSDAIHVAADGVRLSNLTVRNASSGITLDDGAGEATWAGGEETLIDHVLVHSAQYPINISQSAALKLSDSTLVGSGADPILRVDSRLNTSVHTWNTDRAMELPVSTNGGLASTAGRLYAMPGGSDPNIYVSTPGADGALGTWTTAFRVPQEPPSTVGNVQKSILAAGGNYVFQMHPFQASPDFGSFNGEIRAVAVAADGDVYVGGSFTNIGALGVLNIARWDSTDRSWHPLGELGANRNGVNGPVNALTIVSNGDVFVGGSFSQVYNGTAAYAYNVVRWDGSQWRVLGSVGELANGTDGPVYALARTSNDVVAIGGDFEVVRASYNGYIAGEFALVENFAMYNETLYTASAGWLHRPGFQVRGVIRCLSWSGGDLNTGSLYAGGSISAAGTLAWAANNVIVFQNNASWDQLWRPVAGGIPGISVSDIAWSANRNKVYAVSDDAASLGVYQWDRSTSQWSMAADVSGPGSALAADARGNVFAGMVNGSLHVVRQGSDIFDQLGNETLRITDLTPFSLLPDRSSQVLVARSSASGGSVKWWGLEGVFRRNLSGTSWDWIPYPIAFRKGERPTAVAADNAGNVYASAIFSSYYLLYRLNANSQTWELRASLSWKDYAPELNNTLTDLVWANGYLYGLAYSATDFGQRWYLYRHDPSGPPLNPNNIGPTNGWTQVGLTSLPNGATTSASRSLAWDGVDCIYVLQASGAYRFQISTSTWDVLAAPTISFTLLQKPVLGSAGNNLYVYATPGTNVSSNIFRYGRVGLQDVRLTVERTALVAPDVGANFAWTNLGGAGGTYRFQILTGVTNTWVGPSSASWTPTLPGEATRLTSAQADFVAPLDGLYRLGASSLLTVGYHRYKAVAHVYPSQADCSTCGSSLVWGETAFATIREAVESGAARVLVHPGRYPQSFYLVSGVEVLGSGAELTVLTPPAGTPGTLVTAEGVAHASLARVTLSGGASWEGFLAEGGASGLKLLRCIIRDLKTGVRVRGSQVEVINNTIIRNTDGIAIDQTAEVTVRNTILAYNTGTGLTYGLSLTDTYNDYWGNGRDMNPEHVTLGSLFVDPRFRSLAENDLRLSATSPLIDMGAPNDPTTPGGGGRVDLGYAEYNSASFYVSKSYSETSLNDGLTWGMDAFNRIQPALEAAAATLHGLRGAIPEGGYSVAVEAGTYNEQVSLPSHVRLVGSGAEGTIIDAGGAGSTVVFDAVIDSQLSGFTVRNASSSGAGIELKNAASGITLNRNIIRSNASDGIRLSGSSSAQALFNTIVGNGGSGVYASGTGAWIEVHNNILDGNAVGLQAAAGGLVRNNYNLLHNTTNLVGVTAGDGTLTDAPAFASSGIYVLSAASPALDAAQPWLKAPLAGGLRADLGYKELIASPLTLLFGPQIDSTVTGNAGVAQVEVGVVRVSDVTQPVTATLPTAWQTLNPVRTDQPLFYWSHSLSQADPGLYRVYSRASDAAGNLENEALDWYEGAFVVDNTAPTVSWVIRPPTIMSGAAVLVESQVSGTVTTGSGTRSDVAQVYFTVTGPLGSAYYPAEGGKAWIQLPATGGYLINAVAVDEAGNQASQTANMNVSGTSSVATVTSHVTSSSVNSTAIQLRGYVRFAEAGSGVVNISVTGGTTVQARLDQPGEAFSAWSAALTLPAGDGLKSVSVIPSLGSTVGLTTSLNLTLDTTAPSVSVTAPANGSSVVQTAAFAGLASDTGSGLRRVDVSVDGGYTWRQATTSAGTWSLDLDLGLGQEYVSYPVRVRAVDSAGNMTVAAWLVAADSTPPTDLAPVTFSQPVGQHVDLGTTLTVGWNTPVDASGSALVRMVVDTSADTLPTTVVDGTSAAASLNATGEWYVHLMVEDGAGNTALNHFGPWYVRNMSAALLSDRRESIILDGNIDLAHDEWQATDLLGIDARSGIPQELYLSWDGQYIFLGWSGAWWTLDGTLWAYLGFSSPGTSITVDGRQLPDGLAAARAVEIRGPGEGMLWTWEGGSWTAVELTFVNGPSGDTELRIPWGNEEAQALQVLAFALPRQVEVAQELQAQTLVYGKQMAPVSVKDAALAVEGGLPWAIFPTTNPLAEPLTQNFEWAPEGLSGLDSINAGQPAARTVVMTASSRQPGSAAQCGDRDIVYDIVLENREAAEFMGLRLALAATTGLSYQSVTGAGLSSGAPGDSAWVLEIPTLAAGASAHVVVKARTASALGSLTDVTSTFTLSAGATMLTAESNPNAKLTHRVDGESPNVSIKALDGSAIPAGMATFSGLASDGAGTGVARVEVSTGGGWATVSGGLAWSFPLYISGGTSEVTLQAQAWDHCGLSSSTATHTFIVDSTPPQVTWTLPGALTTIPAILSGTTFDPAPAGGLVARVEVQADSENAPWRAAAGPFAPQDGAQGWTWSWITPQEDGVAHQMRVRATDAVGNLTVTDWQPVVVDTLAPQLTVTERLHGQTTGPLLSGTVTDGSGVQAVQVLVYDPLGGEEIQQAAVTGETWAFMPDLNRWPNGTYALRAQALDLYGNVHTKGPYYYEHIGTPAPVLSGLSPAAARAGSVDVSLTLTGSSFVPTSVVLWNGEPLATTFVNSTQLTAVIPAARLAEVRTAQLTVFTPAPGGGTSNVRAFFVTFADVGVIDQAVESGIDPSSSSGLVAASATGEGLLVVAQYNGNPGSAVNFAAYGSYFDIYAPLGSFEQVVIVTCGMNGGDTLYWWDVVSHEWQKASPQGFAGDCVTLAVTGASTPSLSQLQHTYFAAGGKALAAVDLIASPNPAGYGQPIRLAAAVSGGYGLPTGRVTFRDGANTLPGCADLNLAEGEAQCEVTGLATGAHALNASYSGDSVYQPASGNLDLLVEVAGATLILTDLEYVYDGTFKAATVTTEPPDLTGVMVTYDGEQTLPKDAGSYHVVVTLDNPNYLAADVTGILTIQPAGLTVTADDKGREYNQPNPVFTVTYSGFVGGEGKEVLSGEPDLFTTAAEDSPTGHYPIHVVTGTLSAANYTFTFIPGTLTVGLTDQIITFDPLPDRTYGDADFEVTAAASSGLPVSFSVGESDACTIYENIVHITRAGSCTVIAAQVGDENYRPAILVPQTFTVRRGSAAIVLSDLTQEYDGTAKAATVTTIPAGVTILLTYDGSESLPFNAGSYRVAAVINDPNYEGALVEDTFIITPRPVAVTAGDQRKAYGEADPDLTYQVTSGSLVEGDDFSGWLTRDPGEEVGVYAIRQGSLAAGSNYALTFIEGKLTIAQASLTVKADNQSRPYSDPNPTFTYTITGFIPGETLETSGVSGSPVCSTTANLLSEPGPYDITCTTGSLAAENYSFSFEKGTLTVGKETAYLTYTGDLQITTSKTNVKATITLAATLEEEQDATLGDQLAGQQVLFRVLGFGGSQVATCTATIGSVTNGKGYGSCSVTLGAADPYQVKIDLVTNAFYSAEQEDVAVLINDPGSGMAVGGGWLVDPNTGRRVNFGFTVKFLKNGNVQGNSLFIYRVTTDLSQIIPEAPAGLREYNWIIKSNAMTGLNIYNCQKTVTSGCKATISGKNNIQAVDRLTGVVYSIGGNYQFQVDVTDNREPASQPAMPSDQYAIRVWNASGTYYELGDAYDDNGRLVAPLPIRGGNVQVKAK